MKNKSKSIGFKYAFSGIFKAFKTEKNIWIHLCIMILVIICGIWLKISLYEWYVCILLFAMVFSSELINTAIETTVDMITEEKNEKAKMAKDVAAGAVLVNAIASVIIGLLIFIPKLI